MGDLIPVSTINLGGDDMQMVDAYTLYEFLELDKSNYSKWVNKAIVKNAYAIEWEDYILWPVSQYESNNYILTIDFAKRVAMKSNSKKWEQVREYFINIEKAFKKVISKPKTTLEMLKEAVLEIETKEKQVLLLEKTVSKQNETNAQLFEMTAMATKTGIKTLKNDLGAEINTIIHILYGNMFPWDHKAPHLHARKLYEENTGIIYWWAKISSLPAKQNYLRWLQKQRGGENILQDNF